MSEPRQMYIAYNVSNGRQPVKYTSYEYHTIKWMPLPYASVENVLCGYATWALTLVLSSDINEHRCEEK